MAEAVESVAKDVPTTVIKPVPIQYLRCSEVDQLMRTQKRRRELTFVKGIGIRVI